MYFLFFKLHSWGKRFGSSRSRFIQRFPISVDPLFYLSSFQNPFAEPPVVNSHRGFSLYSAPGCDKIEITSIQEESP